MLSMKLSKSLSIKRSLAAFAALTTLWAPAALAESPRSPESAEAPPMLRAPDAAPADVPTETPTAPAGLRIFVDPVTGELTPYPTPQQAGELAQAFAAARLQPTTGTGDPGEGLVRFELSGGGTGVRLDDRFVTSTVIHLGPDGQLHVGCTHDPDAALEAHGNEAHGDGTQPTGAVRSAVKSAVK